MAVMSLLSETLGVMVYVVEVISNCLWRMIFWCLKGELENGMSCQSLFVKVFEGRDGL